MSRSTVPLITSTPAAPTRPGDFASGKAPWYPRGTTAGLAVCERRNIYCSRRDTNSGPSTPQPSLYTYAIPTPSLSEPTFIFLLGTMSHICNILHIRVYQLSNRTGYGMEESKPQKYATKLVHSTNIPIVRH